MEITTNQSHGTLKVHSSLRQHHLKLEVCLPLLVGKFAHELAYMASEEWFGVIEDKLTPINPMNYSAN